MTFPRWTFLAAAAFLAFIPDAHALDKIILQLKWKHQFQFAGYYAAIQQGYYRDAGFEVELREATPGVDPGHEVLEGRADFGVASSNIILLRGKGEPVVVLAVIYQHSPFVLLSTVSSGVRDIHELATKPIMMEPDAAELLAYFRNEGVDHTKLEIVPHTFNIQDLTQHKVRGMSAYSTDEPFELKEAEVPYTLMSPRAGGIDFYGDSLFTTEAQIREHPDRVKAFLDASLRGWDYAMKHREEMVDLILKDYNRGKSRGQLLFEAEETARLVHPELIELGYVNPGRWENIAATYKDLGMLQGKVKIKDFIYERSPKRDLRWIYGSLGGILLLAAATGGWSLLTARMNRRLRLEVDARKLAEEHALSESAAKSRYLSVLAHEVRNPLSAILSSVTIYRISDSQKEKDEVVEIAESTSYHLLRMVDNILDQSKLDAEHMQVECLPVLVREFLGEIVDLFRGIAVTKGITLDLEVDPAMPSTIYTDPTRLRQILSNLVSNALKFTTTGGVRVVAKPDVPDADGMRVVMKIIDNGPGLTEEEIGRIFQPYQQADASVSRTHGGTGLGLTISAQLARLLGGEIRVESVPGEGATFIVPIRASPPMEANPEVV